MYGQAFTVCFKEISPCFLFFIFVFTVSCPKIFDFITLQSSFDVFVSIVLLKKQDRFLNSAIMCLCAQMDPDDWPDDFDMDSDEEEEREKVSA